MSAPPSRIRSWLARSPQWVLACYAALAGFSAYFSMYAFRRPFTAATYAGTLFESGPALKTAFVLSQLVGYAISKWIGIKVCSEAAKNRRALLLLLFIVVAELALVLFAVLPPWGKLAALCLNGLPLGMVWGLVVGYLEGRRCSDFLLAGLCGSFIVSSAAVKDSGLWLISRFGINEYWMPAATGLLFLPLFVVAVLALVQLPPPDPLDEAARAPRRPMPKSERRAFLRRFAPGLVAVFICYFLLTAYRDFRDGYGTELFRGLGYGPDVQGLFSRTEIWVAVGTLLGLAGINAVRDNRRALLATFILTASGMILLLGSTFLQRTGALSGLNWMIATGLATYLAYVPINAVLFERLMAASGSPGTAVFGIQMADSIGYTGTALVLLVKDLVEPSLTHVQFFHNLSWFIGVIGLLLLAFCAVYFHRRTKGQT